VRALAPSPAEAGRPRVEATRRHRFSPPGDPTPIFWLLLAVVVVLNLFGLVMVLSASSVVALDETGSTWSYFGRQSLWLAIGAVALAVFLYVDRRFWRRTAALGLISGFVLLVAVLLPGVGVTVNGATRWLQTGPFQIQPSELAKLAALVYAADLLGQRADEMANPRRTFWPVVGVLALIGVPILAQPNLGTAIVLAVILLTLLFIAGARVDLLALVTVAATGVASYLVLTTPFRRARFFAFLNPWADPSNTGYQNLQALVALGDGGVLGVGLGASRAKWEYLPEAQTDFIFAVIGEELGLVGAVLLVVLFAALCGLGVGAARAASDRYSMLVAVGVTVWLTSQAFLNLGMVTGLLPVTGVPLPFISFGGSSLFVTMAAAGLLLNIARHQRPRPGPAGRR
jgi:cell division protein FtsW